VTIEPPREMFIVMFDRFFSGKKIPLDPPLPKGAVFWTGHFPLFEEEGTGEIYVTSHQQTMP